MLTISPNDLFLFVSPDMDMECQGCGIKSPYFFMFYKPAMALARHLCPHYKNICIGCLDRSEGDCPLCGEQVYKNYAECDVCQCVCPLCACQSCGAWVCDDCMDDEVEHPDSSDDDEDSEEDSDYDTETKIMGAYVCCVDSDTDDDGEARGRKKLIHVQPQG